MFKKLFEHMLNYVNKKETGQRFRMFITLILYAIVLSITIFAATWGFVMVFEYFKLYQYIPLWAYEHPFLFMVPIGFAMLAIYLCIDCFVIAYEVEDRLPWTRSDVEGDEEDDDDEE